MASCWRDEIEWKSNWKPSTCGQLSWRKVFLSLIGIRYNGPFIVFVKCYRVATGRSLQTKDRLSLSVGSLGPLRHRFVQRLHEFLYRSYYNSENCAHAHHSTGDSREFSSFHRPQGLVVRHSFQGVKYQYLNWSLWILILLPDLFDFCYYFSPHDTLWSRHLE